METNPQYLAHDALRDAARARVDMAAKIQVRPLDYALQGLVGLSFVAASFSDVLTGWPRYLVAAIPLLVILPVALYGARRATRVGAQQGLRHLLRDAKVALAILGVGFVALMGSMVVRDRLELGNGIAVAGAIVLALSFVAATWWIDRATRRNLRAARTELAALEQA